MKAFIFDLNGTMVHDMDYHTAAWQHIFNHELGGHFTWDEVKPQMYGKNQEVLERLFGPGRFTAEEIQQLSLAKETRYQNEFRPHLRLLPGLAEFLAATHERGILLAIGSAAIPFNIDFVVDGLDLRPYFRTIVSADDVTLSKPHPETFLKAAQQLGVAAADCIVFEDVPKGVEAADGPECRPWYSRPPTRLATLPGSPMCCTTRPTLRGHFFSNCSNGRSTTTKRPAIQPTRGG